MNAERRVAVVADSACSVRPESPEAKNLGVTIIPLEVRLWKNGQYVSYPDTEETLSFFYQEMRTSKKIPQTSGAVPQRFVEAYQNLQKNNQPIISIHITSELSGAWGSAVLAKKIALERAWIERREPLPIEIIDTQQASIATWFMVELAASLSQKGANLKDITDEIKETLPKTHICVSLSTFENLFKGGRANEIAKAVIASALSIYPILTFEDGLLKDVAKARTPSKARAKMVEMIGDGSNLAKLAVVHTNAPDLAKNTREELKKIYPGEIPIYEAGPALATHASSGAIAIASQYK